MDRILFRILDLFALRHPNVLIKHQLLPVAWVIDTRLSRSSFLKHSYTGAFALLQMALRMSPMCPVLFATRQPGHEVFARGQFRSRVAESSDDRCVSLIGRGV